MIKVALVEDEKILREYTKSLIVKNPLIEIVAECGSVEELKKIIFTKSFDLLILDIELKDGNSIELIEHLGILNFDIIFLTAYSEYSIKALNLGATYYLLKPLEKNELYKAIDKIIHKHYLFKKDNIAPAYNENMKLALRTLNEIELVSVNEIIYLASDGNYTNFHLLDKKTITVSKPMKTYTNMLPESIFLKSHQSYIVNKNFIHKYILEGTLILKNGDSVPVSRANKDEIRKNFLQDYD